MAATAKRDLKPGDLLDGIGGFTAYGQAENADVIATEGLLPIGLAEGGVMRRAVAKGETLRFPDVDLPKGKRVTELYLEMLSQNGFSIERERMNS
ncbi:MAG: SAF domain-containing protein [Gemmobacter sp.]|nr:SAF domain-containing protein [Gemmobacter sp.]